MHLPIHHEKMNPLPSLLMFPQDRHLPIHHEKMNPLPSLLMFPQAPAYSSWEDESPTKLTHVSTGTCLFIMRRWTAYRNTNFSSSLRECTEYLICISFRQPKFQWRLFVIRRTSQSFTQPTVSMKTLCNYLNFTKFHAANSFSGDSL